jgi:hypothetical protein
MWWSSSLSKIGPARFSVWPLGGRMWKQKKCNNSLNTGSFLVNFVMIGTSSKGTSDMTYFSRSQMSKFVHAHLVRHILQNIWPGLPTSSFQFLYSPYPSPGAQSPSKCFTGCSLPAGGIQWCARTHCSARLMIVVDCLIKTFFDNVQ